MVGFGEVCSDIAAMLFALEFGIRHIETKCCTSGPRQWGKMPSSGGTAMFARGCEIDFSNPAKKRALDPCSSDGIVSKIIPSVIQEEKDNLYSSLAQSGVLSILPNYAQEFTPKHVRLSLPSPLTSLYDHQIKELTHPELIEKCHCVIADIDLDHNLSRCDFVL